MRVSSGIYWEALLPALEKVKAKWSWPLLSYNKKLVEMLFRAHACLVLSPVMTDVELVII